ncbi:MAG: C1 family peptidase [Acidobacteria bacterium]|nr:C1 family peptidase [Acidobacteriota bacterium]
MRRMVVLVLTGAIVGLMAFAADADEPKRDTAVYVDKYEDPILKEMDDADDALKKAAKEKTEELLEAYRAAEKERTEPKQKLRFDLGDLVKPESPDAFTSRVWHFPPTPQYKTGTCWSFGTTSFIESEIKRLHDREIKLSEMWTAYWEFVNKARGYIASRGESALGHGSQSAALLRVLDERGVVPRSVYEGVILEDTRFNHDLMLDHIRALLEWCKDNNFWDEEVVIAMVRELLDATMGRPPETVVWEGRELTPKEFLSDVCGIDPGDYVSVMSTMSEPFWSRGEYAVPDNWWHDASYLNVPLDVWFDTIVRVATTGNSLVFGGDVSEPGMNGFEDVAVIPTFDIPAEYIDQSARELRFANRSTTDDHLIHLVGHMKLDGHDWFLIKDSNRSSRYGSFEGYYFYRDDYVRLKMLMFTVHKDQVREILDRVDG